MKYGQLWSRIPIFIHFGRVYRSQQHSEEECHDGKVKKRAKIPQERNCVMTLYCVTVPIVLGISTINCIPWKAKSHRKQMKSTGWSDTPSFGRIAQKKHCPGFKYSLFLLSWDARKLFFVYLSMSSSFSAHSGGEDSLPKTGISDNCCKLASVAKLVFSELPSVILHGQKNDLFVLLCLSDDVTYIKRRNPIVYAAH